MPEPAKSPVGILADRATDADNKRDVRTIRRNVERRKQNDAAPESLPNGMGNRNDGKNYQELHVKQRPSAGKMRPNRKLTSKRLGLNVLSNRLPP